MSTLEPTTQKIKTVSESSVIGLGGEKGKQK